MLSWTHCRSCGFKGLRGEDTDLVEVPGEGTFDRCKGCGSVDIDVMSEAGLTHEQSMEAS